MSTASELLIEQSGAGDAALAPNARHTQSPEPGTAGFNPHWGGESNAPSRGWTDAVADVELREFIANKGWKDPAEMAAGYRNLEKLVGGEKVPLPKGDADAEGWERVYKALGRPARPEDYQLGDLESAAQYHKLGLTARQATGLSAWQDTLKAAQEQKTNEETAAQRSQQLAAIRKEWGGEFDENVRLGKRAVREFGLEGSVEALEAALGSGELLKLTAKLGRGLKEDAFAGKSAGRTFGKSKDEAKEEIGALSQDKAFVQRYLINDVQAVKQFAELHRIAFE